MDIRILVVDDDQDSCDLIEKVLKKEGYRVSTLTDGRQTEEELRKHDTHLAIVDHARFDRARQRVCRTTHCMTSRSGEYWPATTVTKEPP